MLASCNPEAKWETDDVIVKMNIGTVSAGFIECNFSTNKEAYYLIACQPVQSDYDPMTVQKQFMTLNLDSAFAEYLMWRSSLLYEGEFNIAPFESHSLQYGDVHYVFTGLGLSSRAAAEQYCEDRGGHLAVITSQELNDRLYQLCLDSGVETAIFGYSDEKIEGNWEWVTDAQPGYTNWGRTEPNGAADGEDYAIFSSSEANGRWNDTQFGHETTDFICQWNDNGIVDEPIQVRIPDDAVKFDGHQYYLFDNGKSNWCEAQNFCKSIGGDLVVINNVDENQFLMDYIEDMGYDRAFIGYSDEESEGRWYWVSGKTSRFVDWGITRDGDVAPTNETRWYNFAEIDLQLTAGSWKDGVFGQDTTAYICEWE